MLKSAKKRSFMQECMFKKWSKLDQTNRVQPYELNYSEALSCCSVIISQFWTVKCTMIGLNFRSFGPSGMRKALVFILFCNRVVANLTYENVRD